MKRKQGLMGQLSTRAAPEPPGEVDAQARTFALSLASEIEVRRYHWDLGEFDEVLLCGAQNVDLARMTPEAAGPLLLEHDRRALVGVIDSASVGEDRIVRAIARAQRSPEGDQLLTDVADGVRRNVSVGYQIIDVELHEKEGQRPRVVVTRWQPFEVSLVAAGADPTVGVGRSHPEQYPDALIRRLRGQNMEEDDDPKATDPKADPKATEPKVKRIDVRGEREDARKAEQARCRELFAIGQRFGMGEEAQRAIAEGTELEAFRTLALDKIEARQKAIASKPAVDLSAPEAQRFSVGRAVHALLEDDPDLAPFEREVTRAYQARGVKLQKPTSFYIPLRFLRPSGQHRTLVSMLAEQLGLRAAVAKGGTGANLIGTDHLDEEYVPHLLSDLVTVKAGVRILPGLVGDVEIPAGEGSYGTASHIATETTDASEVPPVLRQIAGSPHTIAAFTDFTRRMRLQSVPAIEAIIRTGLADAINELVERTVLTGSGGGGAPTGLYSTAGVTAADFVGFTYSDFIKMWSALKGAKGTSTRLGYITSYQVAAKAMTITRGGAGSDRMIAEMSVDGNVRIDGFPLYPTQESPQTFGSPAVLHGVAFGDWTKIIIAQWGEGVEINVDEAALALKGGRRVIAFFDYDVLVTLNKAFALADTVSVA